MVAPPKAAALFGALVCFVLASATSASAVTAEVAKKCSAEAAKNFPAKNTGNPASRSGDVDGLSQRSFFQKCISNESQENDVKPESEK